MKAMNRGGHIPRCCSLLFMLGLLLAAGRLPTVSAGTCDELALEEIPPVYYIYPEYRGRCPDGSGAIRCYRYHWDWICEKAERLYWDRRLEAAAHAACGCPPPNGVAPASPAVSGKPRGGILDGPGASTLAPPSISRTPPD
jgi:hypothetical protein